MDLLIKSCLFMWIAVCYMSLAKRSDICTDKENTTGYKHLVECKHVFGNFCYEFIDESKNWSQARCSCEKRGGKLVRHIKSEVRNILLNATQGKETKNLTWWLGKSVKVEYKKPTLKPKPTFKNGSSSALCTYLKLGPLQLVTTSDCSQRRGYICALNLQFASPSMGVKSRNARKSRFTRSTDMSQVTTDINLLLQAADTELFRMELNASEPTNENSESFIRYLLEGTQKLVPSNDLRASGIINHIINCTSAILLLSLKRCGDQTNPSPSPLFEQILQIYIVVSTLLGTSASFVIQHPFGTIYQSSFTPPGAANAIMGVKGQGSFVKLPSFTALKSPLGGYSTVTAQLASFNQNIHPSASANITGQVCNLILTDGTSKINLTGLAERIEIYLPQPTTTVSLNSSIVMIGQNPIDIMINISDPNVTVFLTVEPNVTVSLFLLLTQYNHSGYSTNTTLNNTVGYQWMITPDLIQRAPGSFIIKVSPSNSSWNLGITLQITSFSAKCLYWHDNMEMWSNAGCMVGPLSTPNLTQCLCNHLTLFGSSFFVMPNYVDLSKVTQLFATVTNNYVVLALLCAFFGLYLITLMWACYADRRALSRRKMTLLVDSHPCAQYNYMLGIQTGHRKNAGTSANVTIKLIGTEGESEIQNLTDPVKLVFEKGAVDMFLFATPLPLGELQNIRLQHDNSGGSPSWYVDKVIVQDLQTRKVWHFLCNCWLSADLGEGLTKKNFNAAKNNEIASFRSIFQTRTSTGFRDEHIWVSIVNPPWRSPFTRAQRVSCCMSLLLCTMAINIAFWNIPKDAKSPVFFSIGSIQITWQGIIVGLESGLLMFPINILIITIFRNIRPRITSHSKKTLPEENLKPKAVTIATILKETEEVLILLSKSPRNKMSELNERLESTPDLSTALSKIHDLILLIQGEVDSDPHWVHCSRFILFCLSRLLLCLEKMDAKHFQSPEEYQNILSTTNLLLRKAEMVFTSHIAYCPPLVMKKKKSTGGWLPWWCVFIGWFLLLSISGLSTFFTLLYGFQYGKEKSIQWVISLGLSLFQSIFILQPLKVLGVAVFFALILKPVAVEETEEVEQVLSEQQQRCRLYSGRSADS